MAVSAWARPCGSRSGSAAPVWALPAVLGVCGTVCVCARARVCEGPPGCVSAYALGRHCACPERGVRACLSADHAALGLLNRQPAGDPLCCRGNPIEERRPHRPLETRAA